jgi:hypothetical protein
MQWRRERLTRTQLTWKSPVCEFLQLLLLHIEVLSQWILLKNPNVSFLSFLFVFCQFSDRMKTKWTGLGQWKNSTWSTEAHLCWKATRGWKNPRGLQHPEGEESNSNFLHCSVGWEKAQLSIRFPEHKWKTLGDLMGWSHGLQLIETPIPPHLFSYSGKIFR